MIHPSIKRLLPVWSEVPPRFWLEIILETVAVLNLVFYSQIWSESLSSLRVSQIVPGVGAIVIIVEAIVVLRRWLGTYSGPYWARVFFRLVVTGVMCGLAVVGIVLAFSIARIVLIR